jgi:LysM repeat protein
MQHQNKPIVFLCFVFLLIGTALAALAIPVQAAPPRQMTPFPTPTPGPDGRIVYLVQPGDTLLRISLISGVSIDDLRGLNNLLNDTIISGQPLLLGLGGPSQVTPTAGPSPTPTPILPTPSPKPGFGELCVLLYNDINGDAIRQGEEPSVPEGALSINNRSGSVSLTTPTEPGDVHQCFPDLSEGEYSVSVGVPDGYNPTTLTSYIVDLRAGDTTYLDFGAQVSSKAEIQAPVSTDTGERSPVLGILGGLVLLVGIGLAVFAGRLMRSR